MDSEPDQRAQAVVDRIRDVSSKWLAARTVSILFEEFPGALTQLGTGVLVAIADCVFLVSAAHVLKHARDSQVWINPVAEGAAMIPLEHVDVVLANDRVKADFGFIRLPEPFARELASRKSLVRIHDVDGTMPAANWYAALGYPQELNVERHTDKSVPARPMFYATRLHDVAQDPLADFDPAINLVLEYPVYGSGDPVTRKLTTMPDIRGMSGSGIWRLYREGDGVLEWSEDQIQLAGVLHTRAGDTGPFQTASGQAALVGVHFIHLIRTIRSAYPDLAPAIDLIHPNRAR